jgi:hypothetical protein
MTLHPDKPGFAARAWCASYRVSTARTWSTPEQKPLLNGQRRAGLYTGFPRRASWKFGLAGQDLAAKAEFAFAGFC